MKKYYSFFLTIGLLLCLNSCLSTNPYDDYISADPSLPEDDVEIGSSFDLIGPSDYQGYVAIMLYEPDKLLFLINQNDKSRNQYLYNSRNKVLRYVNDLCKKRGDDFHVVTTVDNIIIVIDANKDRSSYKTKTAAKKTAQSIASLLTGKTY